MTASPISRFALTLCLGLLASPGFSQIHVAPGGDDKNPGTISRPVRTVEKAFAMARAASEKAAGDTTIAPHIVSNKTASCLFFP
jgi:hypothetical protein